MLGLFVGQIVLFSLFPLYCTRLDTGIRRTSFYICISLYLLIGGFFGNVYSLPITETINISGGNLCYGALMMTSILCVLVERDVFILRNLIRLVIFVDLFKVLFAGLAEYTLKQDVINPHSIPAEFFHISTSFIILGGVLIITELALLFFLFEKLKNLKLPMFASALVYLLGFICMLVADGIAFPLIAFGVSEPVVNIVIGGLSGKVLMASAFSVPLALYILVKRREFTQYLQGEPLDWKLMFRSRRDLMKEIEDKEYGLKQAETVFEHSNDGLAVIDDQGIVLRCNSAFAQFTGKSVQSITSTSKTLTSLLNLEPSFMMSLDESSSEQKAEIEFQGHHGLLTVTNVEKIKGRSALKIVSLTNIDDLIVAQDQLHYLANHDILTGLPNRRVLDDTLSHEDLIHSALIIFDVDHFKDINDSYGHASGDALLNKIAQMLPKASGEQFGQDGYVLARTGGDEFALLIKSADLSACEALCQKVQKLMTRPYYLGNDIHVYSSLSMGIALQQNVDLEDLFQSADAAMYVAKHAKRGSYQFYEQSFTDASQRTLILSNRLREALEKHVLEVYYQPQVHAGTGNMVGLEALVRWNDGGNWVSPAEFIPVAERSGLIDQLGMYVLETACRDAQIWFAKTGVETLKLSVNVSAHQLRFEQLYEQVTSVLNKTGFPAKALQLELTESAFLEREQEVIPQLEKIRDLGVSLAIDDFGTGYSSLSYLHTLPISTLKIDRSFISRLPTDTTQQQLCRTVIQLAANLQLSVVVEGIETAEQRDFVVAEGCQVIQGYFYSKPVSCSEITNKLLS